MRRPRYLAPCFPLALLLLLLAVQCAGGCLAVAAPAREGRGRFDELLWKSGRSPTAVVRELPRKGQGAMQAYTATTKEDDGDWKPIRITVLTEDLKNDNQRRWLKRYCEKVGEEYTNYLGHKVVCKDEHIMSEQKKQLYEKKIIPMAVKLHAERLLVKPVSDKIRFPRSFGEPCQHFKIPAEHKTGGVTGADMVIYAAAGPFSFDIPVWGATCATLTDLRPSIGIMDFNPVYLTDSAWSVRVAARGLAYALGFSYEAMNEKGIVRSESTGRGIQRKMVTGHNVKVRAAAHFNCSSLNGMELENDDAGAQRKMPHWEERSARDELMALTVGAGYYTALTMAVFADLGYYHVNWSMAEPMAWGNNTGCDF
ncbi:surface protease GP63, partial [Trypanosoma rangeli]